MIADKAQAAISLKIFYDQLVVSPERKAKISFQIHVISWGLVIFYVCRHGNSYQDKQWWKFLKTGKFKDYFLGFLIVSGNHK